MKYYIVFLLIFLSLFGCKTPPKQFSEIPESKSDKTFKDNSSSALEIGYEILSQGSNFKPGLSSIIRTQKELDNFYSVLYGNSAKAPIVDFSKRAVVIAAAGPFNTGGYSVFPVSAIKTGKTIKLVFEISAPWPKDMVTQAFTHPYVIVLAEAEPSDDIFIEVRGDYKGGYGIIEF